MIFTETIKQFDDIQNRIKRPELLEIDDNGHDIAARKVFASITTYIRYYYMIQPKKKVLWSLNNSS